MLAHLRTLVLALFLSGCGFSGALYLPEEPPPAPQETATPGEAAEPEAAPTPEESPATDSAGDQTEVPQP